MTTKKVFVSLGSNIGDQNSYINSALERLSALKNTKIISKSDLMRTSPIGVEGQNDYLNQVIIIETTMQPMELLREFKNIETSLGRQERPRWAEREIDIDIIIYEGVNIKTDLLTIPHRELTNRLFLLKGCLQLKSDYVVEGFGGTIKDLYFNNIDRLSDQSVKSALTS